MRLLTFILAFVLWPTLALAQFNGTNGIFALNHMTFALMPTLTPIGGSGYAIGDTVTLDCPNSVYFSTQIYPKATVTAVSSGAPTSLVLTNPGVATQLPSTGVSGGNNGTCTLVQTATSGSGTGLTVFATFGFIAASTPSIGPPFVPTAYGAKCDGSTDDATALNTFFSIIPANSVISFPPGAICTFKSPLTFPTHNNLTVYGNGAQLTYTGATTTGNLVTWGTSISACSVTYAYITNLFINSTTTMTSGDGFRLNDVCQLSIDHLTVGTNSNLFNAFHYNGGGVANINYLYTLGSNGGEIINGDLSTQLTDVFHYNTFLETGGTGIGLLIGGHCGGCFWDSTDALANTTNVRIDQSQVAAANGQVRFGPNFASDGGGSTLGVDLEDSGAPTSPFSTTATASFASSASPVTISVTACPGTLNLPGFIFDTTFSPPRTIGPITSCTSGSLIVSSTAFSSSGSADALTFGYGPGPGRSGSQFFCEGCWISTTATCLKVGSGSNWEIHLIGARIENCSTNGILNNSNQIRMYLSGGTLAQNGTALNNTAAGAAILFQAYPSIYGNTVANVSGLTPTWQSGCGGSNATVLGDDYNFSVTFGTTTGQNTCVLNYAFQHDSTPLGNAVVPVQMDNALNLTTSTSVSIGYTAHSNVTSSEGFRAVSFGQGF